MGFFKVKRNLAIAGGSVQLGADTNLYRDSANALKTDDALTVAGAFTPTGAVVANGGISSSGTVTVTGKLVAPYGTASPTIATNGQIVVYTKSDVSYLGVYIGGTPNYIGFPNATHGTVTITVGGTP